MSDYFLMTMNATRTGSASATSSFVNVVKVTRKVQADFLAILDTYGYFDEDYAGTLIKDVRVFLDEEVIDTVTFTWSKRGTNIVIDELRYRVISGADGLADDRAGGITYNPALAGADFTIRVTYNSRWKGMSEAERSVIRGKLGLRWGPAGQLNYSGGQWVSDRTYSADGQYGLVRERFAANG